MMCGLTAPMDSWGYDKMRVRTVQPSGENDFCSIRPFDHLNKCTVPLLRIPLIASDRIALIDCQSRRRGDLQHKNTLDNFAIDPHLSTRSGE
jgi:hypothetical protein